MTTRASGTVSRGALACRGPVGPVPASALPTVPGVDSPRQSSSDLAAGHLQGPEEHVTQSDHLLSLVHGSKHMHPAFGGLYSAPLDEAESPEAPALPVGSEPFPSPLVGRASSTTAPVSACVSITSATPLTTSSSRRFISFTPCEARP